MECHTSEDGATSSATHCTACDRYGDLPIMEFMTGDPTCVDTCPVGQFEFDVSLHDMAEDLWTTVFMFCDEDYW